MTQSSSPKFSPKSYPVNRPLPTLRRQLLVTIMPIVLLPLILANIVGYWFIHQNLKERLIEDNSMRRTQTLNKGEIVGVDRELVGILGLITVLLGTVAIAMVLRLSRQLSEPLSNLAKTAREVDYGNLDVVAESRGTREIQTLSQSFNNLIAKLKELLQQQKHSLEQLEQFRQQAEQKDVERQQKSKSLEQDLSELIVNIEDVASGDLTVRADMSFGEIGIVADFFNAIVESLREIVTQVKDAANQVNHSVGENELAIRQLTEESLQQALQINQALDAVKQMSQWIQEVAQSAQTAAVVAHAASDTAVSGDQTMNRTVASILQLRETIGDTSKKVKRLGEACLQISKVINLINEIALKTNYLAVNAGIEAAKAGEEGQGFAIVAKEIGGLASQSGTATREIEAILANIQRETEQVVAAMEQGTTEMTEGTLLVEEAKESLGKIVQVSHQIDQIVQSISRSAASQSANSQTVQQLMAAIAQVAEHTSTSSGQVSSSLQDTVAIAEQLQASVSTFRVTQE